MSNFGEGYINVTGLNVRAFIVAAFDLSPPPRLPPMGLPSRRISETLVDEILQDFNDGAQEGRLLALRLDYVDGRGCKISMWRDSDGQLFIRDSWYDHDDDALGVLLARAMPGAFIPAA